MSQKRILIFSALLNLSIAALPTAIFAASDRAAFEAAAQSCDLPRPGEGQPTEAEEACITKAGFPKPEGQPPRPNENSAANIQQPGNSPE